MSKRISRSRSGDVLVFLILLFCGWFMFFPFVYAVLQSLKPMQELYMYPPRFFVVHPTVENFIQIPQLFDNILVPFGRYLFNSVFIAFAGTLLHVVIVSFAAFPLSKYKFPGSKAFFEIVVLALLFTPTVTALPTYIILAKSGLIDTYWALLLPLLSAPLGLFLMKQFMSTIPDPMLEAASIDGANKVKILWVIVMPIVKPAWLTLSIFIFQAYWNGVGQNYIFSENMKLLPLALSQITSSGVARAGTGAAVTVLLMIPPVLIFLLSQSKIIETMAYSGIKS